MKSATLRHFAKLCYIQYTSCSWHNLLQVCMCSLRLIQMTNIQADMRKALHYKNPTMITGSADNLQRTATNPNSRHPNHYAAAMGCDIHAMSQGREKGTPRHGGNAAACISSARCTAPLAGCTLQHASHVVVHHHSVNDFQGVRPLDKTLEPQAATH